MFRFVLAILVTHFIGGSICAEELPTVGDLVRQLETGALSERVMAAERLGDLGPVAADAIPALVRVARAAQLGSKENAGSTRANRFLYRAALNALVHIGPQSVPALIELLPIEHGATRRVVLDCIRSFGSDAAPAVPALVKLLDDPNPDFRVVVAGVLESIGPKAEAAIPNLLNLFLNPTNKTKYRIASGPLPPQPRVAAVQALVQIGPKAHTTITKKVLPVVLEELKTGEYGSGGSPEEVLKLLGKTGESAVPAIVEIIKKGAPRISQTSAGAILLGLGATGQRAFGELLSTKDIAVRRAMVVALDYALSRQQFPKYYSFNAQTIDVASYVPALMVAIKDSEPKHRLMTAEVLCHLGEKAPREVMDAVSTLFHDPAIKRLAEKREGTLFHEPKLSSFGEIGVRSLLLLLDSDSIAIRKLALGQLTDLQRRWSAVVLPRMRKLTTDPDDTLALDAIYANARFSLDPKDVVLLANRRFVANASPKIRARVAGYLGVMETLGVPHYKVLVSLLDDKDDEVVQAAANAIDSHAPRDYATRVLVARKLVRDQTGWFVRTPKPQPQPTPPGIPELLRALTDEDDDDRRIAAALDLGDRGAAAKAVVPTLKKLVLDPDSDLRFAASYAIARIETDRPALRRLLINEMERAARGQRGSWVAALAFERASPDFPELIPVVARWLEREPYFTAFINGLRMYGPKAKDVVPILRKVLQGPDLTFAGYPAINVKSACEALGAIGPDANAALPELRRVFAEGEIPNALAAREAIRKIEVKNRTIPRG